MFIECVLGFFLSINRGKLVFVVHIYGFEVAGEYLVPQMCVKGEA